MESATEQVRRVGVGQSLRSVLVFQVKLALDALRDFALSPISIIAFIIDVVFRPRPEHSVYSRVMLLGRRSDRMINLFGEYSDDGYNVDVALRQWEKDLFEELKRRAAKSAPPEE